MTQIDADYRVVPDDVPGVVLCAREAAKRRVKLAGRERVADTKAYSSAPLSVERLWYMILHAEGCTLTWTTRDGAATASWITPAVIEGGIYFPTAEGRAKTAGLRRARASR
jgi:hypothetical protein